MEELKRTHEAVVEYLDNLSTEDLIAVHNEYCQHNGYEYEIYENDDDFFETYFQGKVTDAIRAVFYGEYSYPEKYVRFDGYANLDTTDHPEEWIDTDDIASYILDDNEHLFDIEFIEEDEEE